MKLIKIFILSLFFVSCTQGNNTKKVIETIQKEGMGTVYIEGNPYYILSIDGSGFIIPKPEKATKFIDTYDKDEYNYYLKLKHKYER